MAWGKNGTPSTLGSSGDDLDITDLTANKFNLFLSHIIATGRVRRVQTFNNNTNPVYAWRESANGVTDGTIDSSSNIDQVSGIGTEDASDSFSVMYVCSISGEEKLAIEFVVWHGGTGAANDPERKEAVNKFVPSPDADITRIDFNNTTGGADYLTNSNISALGTD